MDAVAQMAPAGVDRLQLYSSGAEAVESALRLARVKAGRLDVVGFWGGFHGKTAGAMSLMGSEAKYGFAPLLPHTTSIPYADCYRCPFGLEYGSCGIACADFVRKAERLNPRGRSQPSSSSRCRGRRATSFRLRSSCRRWPRQRAKSAHCSLPTR